MSVLAAVAALGVVATGQPAWAVEQTLKIGKYVFAHGGVINSGYTLYACDDRANGVGAVTEVRLNTGYTDNVRDPNGSASGCGQKNTSGSSYALQYRVCSGEACTGWARAY
ncbi:hypothetical protein GCM10027614_53050 [Micromonospora vulcania]